VRDLRPCAVPYPARRNTEERACEQPGYCAAVMLAGKAADCEPGSQPNSLTLLLLLILIGFFSYFGF